MSLSQSEFDTLIRNRIKNYWRAHGYQDPAEHGWLPNGTPSPIHGVRQAPLTVIHETTKLCSTVRH